MQLNATTEVYSPGEIAQAAGVPEEQAIAIAGSADALIGHCDAVRLALELPSHNGFTRSTCRGDAWEAREAGRFAPAPASSRRACRGGPTCPEDERRSGLGGESFTVGVPGAAEAGRYRVSFNTDDRIIPHVDKRNGL